MQPILSILICTVTSRAQQFKELGMELSRQLYDYPGKVEMLFECDNKEISVGKKRQKLLQRSIGEYVVFFDDDDWPYSFFVRDIMIALISKPDCVGVVIDMTTNNQRPQLCCHSLRYPEWRNNVDGYDYVRNVTHRNPIKRELAIQVGFPDMRFGEDRWFSDRVTPLCQSEVFIPQPIFHYRYSSAERHNKKYGIR